MRKVLLAAIAMAFALSAGSAFAADLPHYKAPPPPPPPPPPLWTGFYVGLNAGYTWSNSNNVWLAAYPGPCDPAAGGGCALQPNYSLLSALGASGVLPLNSDGFIGGGQIGYNWQVMNSFVTGVEADIQGIAGSNRNSSFATVIPSPNFPGQPLVSAATVSRSLDYIGTVRGRLGWLFTPTLLVYGTGGLAYGGVTLNTSVAQTCIGCVFQVAPFTAGAFSDTRVGWTAGGGLEWLFMPNWSAKVEYLYYDLGSVTVNSAPMIGTNGVGVIGALFQSSFPEARARFNGNIVRAGVNYHFNWGAPAPVYAKY